MTQIWLIYKKRIKNKTIIEIKYKKDSLSKLIKNENDLTVCKKVVYKFSFVFVFIVEQGRSVKLLIYSSNPNNPSANWRFGLWGCKEN